MSKIEKTLELNITHEILNLADGLWWYLQATSLHSYWHPYIRLPFCKAPKPFATGLPICEEGKDGGGYDVCIKSPARFKEETPRLLFMQFKAGVEKPFCKSKESKFFGNKNQLKTHVVFEFNNNTKRNQHYLLRTCAEKAGNKNAALYVFPRIVNTDQLVENIGKLLTKTSFMSISEMDMKALKNGVEINDGNIHKFRTCYHDYNNNEVNFFFFFFGKPIKSGGVLGEIFAIRIYRALKEVVLDNNSTTDYFFIKNAMIWHLLNLGAYFSISSSKVKVLLDKYSSYSTIFSELYEKNNFLKLYESKKQIATNYEEEIFDDIWNSISEYFKWLEEIEILEKKEIPIPSSDYTIAMDNKEIKFNIGSKKDLKEITYSIL